MPSSPSPITRIGSFQGLDLLECELRSATGVLIRVINYGAVIRDWQVPVANGTKRSVVLGFDRFEHYPEHSPFFGAIVGRMANRIGGAKFGLDGREYKLEPNEGHNHLHGGSGTFAKRMWRMEPIPSAGDLAAVRLSLDSPDGDGGYPGHLRASVTYSLRGNRLRIEMEATTDVPCPVNLVQHNYFNLAGHGDIRDHWLSLASAHFTPFGADKVPSGEIRSVEGTEMDFRAGKLLRNNRKIGNEEENEEVPMELDHNFVLDSERDMAREPVAVLRAPDRSLTLSLWTDQPGLQVYTSKHLSLPVPGLHGQFYPPFGAICLEDQNFPDAVNHAHFPNSVVRPGEKYRHWCEIEIA